MASRFDTLFTQKAADRDAVRHFYGHRSPYFAAERDRLLGTEPLPPDPDVDAAVEDARGAPPEPPRPSPPPVPARKPVMALDLFKARAGALASDRGKPISERVAALKDLAEASGYSVPIEDLRRVAEHGIATLDFRAGPEGSPHRVTTIRVRPPDPPPASSRPGAAALPPGEKVDPLMHGANKLALQLINASRPDAGRIAAQLATHVRRQAGREARTDAWFAGLVPDIEKAIRWRRENGGRPYNGFVSLETTTDPAPIDTPARIADAQMRERIAQSRMPGTSIGEAPPPETIAERTEEAAFRLHKALGDRGGVARHRARELRTVVGWTPILGGIDSIQRGSRDIENGRTGSGATDVVLGAFDFGLPVVRKGGKIVLGAVDLRRLAEAGGTAVEIDRAVASRADELLESGARLFVHTPAGSHRITGPNLTDETGRRWTAQDILAGRDEIRLEISRPRGRGAGEASAARDAYSRPTGHREGGSIDPDGPGIAERTFGSRRGAATWAKAKGIDLAATHAIESRGKRFAVVERGSDELEELVRRAEEAQRELVEFGKSHPAKFLSPGVKSRKRIVEKVELEDYSGPADLKDLARGAFVARSIAEAEEIAASIRKRFPIDQDKGWKRNPDTGYLDHKLIVRLANGQRGEIQILPEPVSKVKTKTDQFYRSARTSRVDVLRDKANQRQLDDYDRALAGTEFASLGSPAPAPRFTPPEGPAASGRPVRAGSRPLQDPPPASGKAFKSRRAAEAWARSNGFDLGGRHVVERRGGRFVIVETPSSGAP